MKLDIIDTILIDSKIFGDDFEFQDYNLENKAINQQKLSENKLNSYY